MIKKLSNRFLGFAALVLLSGSASAEFTATATLEFLDCSCEVRSKHSLILTHLTKY